jgi:hypothetical protein
MVRLSDNNHVPETTAVQVDAQTTRTAEKEIVSCETCSPDTAEVPFDSILDSITGCDPTSTDYVLSEPAQCPECGARLLAGSWRWTEAENEGRTAFIIPSTLVTLKNETRINPATLRLGLQTYEGRSNDGLYRDCLRIARCSRQEPDKQDN